LRERNPYFTDTQIEPGRPSACRFKWWAVRVHRKRPHKDCQVTKTFAGEIGPKPFPLKNRTCWSCGSMRAVHFCESWGKLQPPAAVDYFTFLGLPLKLSLDIAALERDFYGLSRRLHPDHSTRASALEQEWSLEQSALLNDAYRTLRDPIKRTEYLLKLEGVELAEQSKSATEQARRAGEIKKQIVPPDLLEEVFELNLQLEQLRGHKKTGEHNSSVTEEIRNHKIAFETRYEALLDELRSYWNEWDALIGKHRSEAAENERRQITRKMVDLLNRRNYIRNLVRDVNAVLEA